MTTSTIHILTEEGDIVPSTGDPIAVLTGEPQVFVPGLPARPLTPAEVKAIRTVEAIIRPKADSE